MTKSTVVTFGPIDVSDRERELSFMVYCSTSDSLNVTITLLGMMSPNASDTLKSLSIFSGTYHTINDAITIADTLNGNTQYPYIFGRVTNSDADSTLTGVNGWLYMRPREIIFNGTK